MNTPFPFELPSPSIWYVVLYAATLLLHVAFMSYVLVGALLLGLAGLRARLHAAHRSGHADGTGGDRGALAPMARVLKDWMPSALSAAITAGIAPLLFVLLAFFVVVEDGDAGDVVVVGVADQAVDMQYPVPADAIETDHAGAFVVDRVAA